MVSREDSAKLNPEREIRIISRRKLATRFSSIRNCGSHGFYVTVFEANQNNRILITGISLCRQQAILICLKQNKQPEIWKLCGYLCRTLRKFVIADHWLTCNLTKGVKEGFEVEDRTGILTFTDLSFNPPKTECHYHVTASICAVTKRSALVTHSLALIALISYSLNTCSLVLSITLMIPSLFECLTPF